MTGKVLFLLCISLTLWIAMIESHGHGHSHDHGHGHGHAHHHGHSHDHGHHHGHGHAHDHSNDEAPSFKYSRAANQPDHGHAHSDHSASEKYAPPHYDEGSDDDDDVEKLVEPFSVITWALGSTLGISLAPVVILFFIRVSNTPEHQSFLKILLSFASGGLLGDAFLHLIPHSIAAYQSDEGEGHGHSHSHSHAHGESHDHSKDLQVGLYILMGIFLFLLAEKFVRHIKGDGHGHSHSHSHSHDAPTKNDDGEDDPDEKKKGKKSPKKAKPKAEVPVQSPMKISGYLNLIADGLHNFTDGLAIGSSYLLGRKVGITTTFAIFLHEIPHEIGDYAILIQNGCSRKKAMFLQLTTAIGALLGCLIGLLFHSAGAELWATQTFLPITAGGFIYIATVSVIPELLEKNTGLKQSLLEMTAMILGVFVMVLVSLIE